MRKLKQRFYGLYSEYGRTLWTAIILQAISLTILTLNNILLVYSTSFDKFKDDNKDVLHCLFELFYNIVSWIIPLVVQLSCLIFGYIRHKRADEFHTPYPDSDRSD